MFWLMLGGASGFCIAGVICENVRLLYVSGVLVCLTIVGGLLEGLLRRGA
jgi:hypothetical protein